MQPFPNRRLSSTMTIYTREAAGMSETEGSNGYLDLIHLSTFEVNFSQIQSGIRHFGSFCFKMAHVTASRDNENLLLEQAVQERSC